MKQILDESNDIHSISCIILAERNPHVDPADLLQSNIIKELHKLFLILSESIKKHDSVDYVYFFCFYSLMRADFMNFMGQGIIDLVINSWGNLKNIINNEELPKTVNFVYTGNVSRPSYDIPKMVALLFGLWLRKSLHQSHKTVKKLFLGE